MLPVSRFAKSVTAPIVMCLFLCVDFCAGQIARADDLDAYSCGDLQNAYGPFDYADPVAKADKLPIVETHHFTREVETLQRGLSSTVAGDLDYTLRAFPNHYRALWSVALLQLRNPNALKSYRSADCYFDRAIRWRPQDGNVRMIHGMYMLKKGDLNAALASFTLAVNLMPENAEAHYNIGLLYVDMGKLDLAREHAQRAYALGYPLPGLRNMLRKRGAWPEKTDASPPAVSQAR